jgi:hypothetical protein
MALFGALLAIVPSLLAHGKTAPTVGYYLFLLVPFAFLMLYYLHLFDSYLYLRQEFYVRNMLDRALSRRFGAAELAGPTVLEDGGLPWSIRQLQGVSRQMLHLLPVVGSYLVWLLCFRQGGRLTPVEISITVLQSLGAVFGAWCWYVVARGIPERWRREHSVQ